tara:strand:- start:1099 stop:2232 length:1134 start_codon:yes stop_codon:yes gene_type:complete
MKKLLCVLLFLLTLSSCSSTEPPKVPITELKDNEVPMLVETMSDKVGGVIWAMDFLEKDKLILTLRDGQIKTFDLKTKKLEIISGVQKVLSEGQGGLLDIAVDPDFKSNQYIYYTYSAPLGELSATRLERAKLVGNKLVESKSLFEAKPAQSTAAHYGSRIAFDHQGHIFVSLGERTERELSQDLSKHMGKIVRLNLDGSIPKDNPFLTTKNALAEIWSYGHRNPQGLYYDQATKELWVNEHGPRGGDEINLVIKAANYGWPKATYGREYYGPKITEHVKLPGVEAPRHVWLPSIAPSDLTRYQGAAFPSWKGSFFSGALALEHLNRVVMVGNISIKEERYLSAREERIRSVVIDQAGHILVGTDTGKILKLSSLTR